MSVCRSYNYGNSRGQFSSSSSNKTFLESYEIISPGETRQPWEANPRKILG